VEEEGVIKEVIKADAAPEEELKDDKEKMEFASKEDMQNLKNEMDELRKMVEGKKEEMSKEDLAKAEAEKAELAKQELAKQEPPKKVTHTPEKEVRKNINVHAKRQGTSTKGSVYNKLFS
jgi:hypothetical protein